MHSLLRTSLIVAITGCAAHHGSGTGGDDDGSNTDFTLEVTPATAAIALAQSGSGYAATQAFTVTAHYASGSDVDVTATVGITSDDGNAVAFAGGTATATIAGHYTIQATLDTQAATATLDVSLTGSSTGSGVTQTESSGLDGTPGTGTPTIAYPPAGALFPVNVAPLEIHTQKTDASQTIARVTFTSGTNLSFSYYETCAASPNPTTFTNACIVTLDSSFATQLAGVSEADDVQITVRLAAADGSKLVESAPLAAAWSKTPLSGGLYYWTTAGSGDTTFNTAFARYDFDGDASTPTIYLSSANAPAVPNGSSQCVGCHAVSGDGTKMAFGLGGSTPGYWSLYDVASQKATISEISSTPYAEMSTFSPDGSRVMTMNHGKLSMQAADASLAMDAADMFPEVTDASKSHPFWSPGGQNIAFVGWTPTQAAINAGQNTGDMVEGGQIWLAPSDGTSVTGAATVLVPRVTGFTSYYPAISDDDQFVVFDRSSCAGPANTAGGWGPGACDGYNDISATLELVPTIGGDPIALTAANGSASPVTTNSWPRWSPDHGTFRGKQLYWVAFSSRRQYGLSLAGGDGSDKTKPQLWFAAVAIDASGTLTTDPSFPAIWLPGQDPSFAGPRGNHTPVWTSKAVTLF